MLHRVFFNGAGGFPQLPVSSSLAKSVGAIQAIGEQNFASDAEQSVATPIPEPDPSSPSLIKELFCLRSTFAYFIVIPI
jgi:hypothetical protein